MKHEKPTRTGKKIQLQTTRNPLEDSKNPWKDAGNTLKDTRSPLKDFWKPQKKSRNQQGNRKKKKKKKLLRRLRSEAQFVPSAAEQPGSSPGDVGETKQQVLKILVNPGKILKPW